MLYDLAFLADRTATQYDHSQGPAPPWNKIWVCWVRGPKGRQRGGSWGEGIETPPHQLEGLGSAVSTPNGVRSKALEKIVFDAFFDTKIAWKQSNGIKFANETLWKGIKLGLTCGCAEAYTAYPVAPPVIVLLHSMIDYWHNPVVCLSVCPFVCECDAVHCGSQGWCTGTVWSHMASDVP